MRFNDLYRAIPDISQKMLTATLKVLVEDGLVSRELFPEVPPKVEYKLSARGESLLFESRCVSDAEYKKIA